MTVDYRSRVRELRQHSRRRYGDQIAQAAQGPPFTPGQLAFMRRVFQSRGRR